MRRRLAHLVLKAPSTLLLITGFLFWNRVCERKNYTHIFWTQDWFKFKPVQPYHKLSLKFLISSNLWALLLSQKLARLSSEAILFLRPVKSMSCVLGNNSYAVPEKNKDTYEASPPKSISEKRKHVFGLMCYHKPIKIQRHFERSWILNRISCIKSLKK